MNCLDLIPRITFIYNCFFFYFLGWLGAMSMSVSFLISPIVIGFCRRKSTRLTAVMGGLVTALGCLFTSFTSSSTLEISSYLGPKAMMCDWFERRTVNQFLLFQNHFCSKRYSPITISWESWLNKNKLEKLFFKVTILTPPPPKKMPG